MHLLKRQLKVRERRSEEILGRTKHRNILFEEGFEKKQKEQKQTWRVEMNLFTKNVRGFADFGKQAEPKNPCVNKRVCGQTYVRIRRD